jgi:hypothetical protein
MKNLLPIQKRPGAEGKAADLAEDVEGEAVGEPGCQQISRTRGMSLRSIAQVWRSRKASLNTSLRRPTPPRSFGKMRVFKLEKYHPQRPRLRLTGQFREGQYDHRRAQEKTEDIMVSHWAEQRLDRKLEL